ncbi:hypothetical protein [Terriglobus sp. RCC_193]|uniref:hypothetical protein n=1 Tax=Terriglobus sp. RCC_193 TaxID=3239218 RepID=UPI0035255DEC
MACNNLAMRDDQAPEPNPLLPRRGGLALLLGVPALCATVVGCFTTFSRPMGGYWDDAVALAQHGRIPQDFTPAGYPELVALGIRVLPSHPQAGAIAVQVLLHVAIAVTLYLCLQAWSVPPRRALVATLLLQLHPELLLSVNKIWDVAYSTELLLLLLLCMVMLSRKGPSIALLLGTGISFGFGLFERPNFLLLALPLAIALWAGMRSPRRPQISWPVALATPIVSGIAAFVLCSLIAFHTIDLPHNGPYNLFAGHNQFSRAALLARLNGEPSILPAAQADGHSLSEEQAHADETGPLFTTLAKDFIRSHPKEEAILPAVKLWTLLRPDTKVHKLQSGQGMFKLLLALALPVWLVLLLLRRKSLDVTHGIFILTAVVYVIPFLLTNADPRFRTPLDFLALVQIIAIW